MLGGAKRVCNGLASFVVLSLSFVLLFPQDSAKAATFEDINQPDMWQTQVPGSSDCVLMSCAMMLRRAALMNGDSNWRSITGDSMRSVATTDGVSVWYNFSYAGLNVSHSTLPGGNSNYSALINILNNHQEGIVLYSNYDWSHAVLLTDYTDGIFYCVDPLSGRRMPIANAWNITIDNARSYWYVSSSVAYLDNNVQPNGVLDVARGGEGTVYVSGWTFGPDAPSKSLQVHVYIGGPAGSANAEGHAITANKSRPDVNNVYGISGNHGYEELITTNKRGNVPVYIYAIGGSNPLIGSQTVTVEEPRTDIGSAKFEYIQPQRYTGSPITPKPHVVIGNTTDESGHFRLIEGVDYIRLTEGVDYEITSYSDNVEVGTAKILITGIGSYKGTMEGTFSIIGPSNISEYNWFVLDTCVYDGTPQKPRVGYPGKPMVDYVTYDPYDVLGVDYTVEYVNNVNAGKASVIVRGISTRLYGSKTIDFTIAPASIENATVDEIEIHNSDGIATLSGPRVRIGNKTLVIGTDYYVVFSWNPTTCKAGVKVLGCGNYTGEWYKEFDLAKPARDGWVTLSDGRKGYAKNGKLVTGWFDLGSSKYYFLPDGSMSTGWTDVVVDGKDMHYYFNPASGNLVRDTWFTIDGVNYYFRPSGNLATGWATIKDGGVDKKYYFEADGSLVKDCWRDIDNGQGVVNHYYFRPSGSMATGWATIDGKQYFFRPSGNMATGWADVTNDNGTTAKHYFDADGVMLVGWQTIGGNTYYFRPSGAMQTGAATIDGRACTFSDKGVLVS